MTRSHPALAALLALLLAPAAAAAAGTPAPALPKTGKDEAAPAVGPIVVAYKGKMVDEAGKPVSGIFPMTFKLYPGLSSKKAGWTETLWVAVDRGIYNVRLGEHKPLPPSKDLNGMVLGVEIRGLGEVVREPFAAGGGAQVQAASAGGTGPAKQHAGQKYADTAGYAVEAEHAKNADRIGNLSLEDIVRKVIEMGGGGGGGGGGGDRKVTVSGKRRMGNHIGGSGGAEYEEVCPKGYVMVGIKGGAAAYVDSLQIICAPLE